MKIDNITLQDLSFFGNEHSVFAKINLCRTNLGTDNLKKLLTNPPENRTSLLEMQDVVSFFIKKIDCWDDEVSNGNLLMVEKFFESADAAKDLPNPISTTINSLVQKLFNRNEYSFIRFSIEQVSIFLKGCAHLKKALESESNLPILIKHILAKIDKCFAHYLIEELLQLQPDASYPKILTLSYKTRRELKSQVSTLIECYTLLDAYFAMAKATVANQWIIPEVVAQNELTLKASGMYHPLLPHPVPMDISFSKEQNFLLLTGANMSGKSTLMRTLGIAALLAHTGMGVPAQAFRISFLNGIISNMHVQDNIVLGESYFMAEVMRMKITAQKLADCQYNLVLMDELFKGTNVHDAYECSMAVIDGLSDKQNNLMILSTHLYELKDKLQQTKGMFFRYCHTDIKEGERYHFTYQLKEGVSNDRIGFLVLKNEGVLKILKGRA